MRAIPYIMYLFLISFHLTVLDNLIAIGGISVNLTILIVSIIAIYKDGTSALWFSVCAGIIAGTPILETMPWHILALAVLAILINQVSVRLNLDSIASRLILLFGSSIVYIIFSMVIISFDSFGYILFRFILPSTLYTALIGWLFFLIKDGHITWAKFKSLF